MDELYPSGGYYTPPKPSDIRRKQELEKIERSLPVIEEVIADFEALEAASKDLTSINLESKVPAEAQILALQELTKFARREKAKFKAKYKSYIEATK